MRLTSSARFILFFILSFCFITINIPSTLADSEPQTDKEVTQLARLNFKLPFGAKNICTDADKDSFYKEGKNCGTQDCDDNNAKINPKTDEVCYNDIDEDCDGTLDNNCPSCDSDEDGLKKIACGGNDIDDTSKSMEITSLAVAIPAISSVSENILSNGQNITISGNNFGTKVAVNGQVGPPVLWDDFEDGTAGQLVQPSATKWDRVRSDNPSGPRYSSGAIDGSMGVRTGSGIVNGVTGGTTRTLMEDDEYRNLYLDYYIRAVKGTGLKQRSNKQVMIWSANAGVSEDGPNTFWWQITQGGEEPPFALSQYPCGNDPYSISYGNGWGVDEFTTARHVQIEYRQASNIPGAPDEFGIARMWYDGVLVTNDNSFGSPSCDPDRNYLDNLFIGHYQDVDSAVSPIYMWISCPGHERCDECPAGASGCSVDNPDWLPARQDEFFYDRIYIDKSIARVEIGNAPTYATSTRREVQVPKTWGDSIEITTNQGGFASNQTVYLYVIDSSGNVNETGFPVVFSTEAITVCGNGICDSEETELSCPQDCDICPAGEIASSCYCGNNSYNSGYCCNNEWNPSDCDKDWIKAYEQSFESLGNGGFSTVQQIVEQDPVLYSPIGLSSSYAIENGALKDNLGNSDDKRNHRLQIKLDTIGVEPRGEFYLQADVKIDPQNTWCCLEGPYCQYPVGECTFGQNGIKTSYAFGNNGTSWVPNFNTSGVSDFYQGMLFDNRSGASGYRGDFSGEIFRQLNDGNYHKWTWYFKHNTSTNGNWNNDGIFIWYIDGNKAAEFYNVPFTTNTYDGSFIDIDKPITYYGGGALLANDWYFYVDNLKVFRPDSDSSTIDPYCSDSLCNGDETCDSCSTDCGYCTPCAESTAITQFCECGGLNYDSGYCCNDIHQTTPCVNETQCNLTQALWNGINSVQTVDERSLVTLEVQGNNCDGETVSFQIFEIDSATDWDLINPTYPPIDITFSGNTAFAYWVTEYFPDTDGPDNGPEFIFQATLVSDPSKKVNVNSDLARLNIADVVEPFCGDNICNNNETYAICPQDCIDPATIEWDPKYDLSCDGVVNLSDVAIFSEHYYQSSGNDQTYFCADFNQDGVVNDDDKDLFKNQLGTMGAIQCCPQMQGDFCGNNACDEEETFESCPQDCEDPTPCIDADNDGYGVNCDLGNDCNDANPNINPAANEICGNDIDEDCSGDAAPCPATINLIQNSWNFSSVSWDGDAIGENPWSPRENFVFTSGQADPFGTNKAFKIALANSSRGWQQRDSTPDIVLNHDTVTASVYVKYGNTSNFIFGLTQTDVSYTVGEFEQTFVFGTDGVPTWSNANAHPQDGHSVTSVGNGWYRLSLTYNLTNRGIKGHPFKARITPVGSSSAAGDHTYVTGFQLESGVNATNYAETNN